MPYKLVCLERSRRIMSSNTSTAAEGPGLNVLFSCRICGQFKLCKRILLPMLFVLLDIAFIHFAFQVFFSRIREIPLRNLQLSALLILGNSKHYMLHLCWFVCVCVRTNLKLYICLRLKYILIFCVFNYIFCHLTVYFCFRKIYFHFVYLSNSRLYHWGTFYLYYVFSLCVGLISLYLCLPNTFLLWLLSM